MQATDLSHAERRVAALRALAAPGSSTSAEELRALADELHDPVYVTDAEGFLTYYNPAAERFWGWQPPPRQQQWCGSWRLFEPGGVPLPHPECPTAVARREARPVRGQAVVAGRPDGSKALCLPFPTPLCDPSGRVAGAVNLILAPRPPTDVDRLVARLNALEAATSDILHDSTFDALMSDIELTTREIADAASHDMATLRMKIAVLRDRISANADPDFPADALTLRLANSLLRDLRRLSG